MTRKRKAAKRRKAKIGQHKRPPCARCGDAMHPVKRLVVKADGHTVGRWQLCSHCRSTVVALTRKAVGHH